MLWESASTENGRADETPVTERNASTSSLDLRTAIFAMQYCAAASLTQNTRIRNLIKKQFTAIHRDHGAISGTRTVHAQLPSSGVCHDPNNVWHRVHDRSGA
jgi:hypothetical protein